MTFEPGDRVKYIGGTTSFIENLYGTVVERDGYTFPLAPEDSVPVEWDDREG
ncbi:MAG: hypothetical protein GWN64_14770, partial [Candidatus Thorarchaeota archaeon]|nr:hypothetical protein [Candidatus Thorarchaeota archaeon]